MASHLLLAFSLLALAVDACVGFSIPAPYGARILGGAKRLGLRTPPRVSAVEDPPSASETRPTQPKRRRRIRRSKRVAVAVVPPPSATDVWGALTKARRELNDPLFHRWPPHANLLYPFLTLRDMGDGEDDEDDSSGGMFERRMLKALERAAARCEPFEVTLAEGEAYGGSDRGVVWLYPRSRHNGDVTAESGDEENGSPFLLADPSEPLIQLHASLEESFPMLIDPRERRGGRFHPHVTLGNYHSRKDAQEALAKVQSWWQEKSFKVNEFYVLRRVEDDGQFEIAATIPLGAAAGEEGKKKAIVHDPPLRFPGMPAEEEEWVQEARANFEQWTEERKARLTAQKLKAAAAKVASDGVVVPEIPDQEEEENEVEAEGKDSHNMFRRTRMRHRRMKSRRRR